MHRIDGGISMLPEIFAKKEKMNDWKETKSVHIQNKITFNVTVNEVIYEARDKGDPSTFK